MILDHRAEGFRRSLSQNKKTLLILVNPMQDAATRRGSDDPQLIGTLAWNERHFRALIEDGPDLVVLLGSEGSIRYVSPSCRQQLGFEPSELVGTNAFFWVHPDDRSESLRLFSELVEFSGTSLTGEFRALCKDGHWKWIEATGTNLLHDPAVEAVLVQQRDISLRKGYEANLRRFEAIVKSTSEAIISMDPLGVIVNCNPAAQRIFGYSEREMLGQPITMLVPPHLQPEHQSLLARCSRGVTDFETVRLAKGGRSVAVDLSVSPIREYEGRITGYCFLFRDITERRCLEQQVLQIADHEKQRLGSELHDDLCQMLVGLSLLGNALKEELAAKRMPQAEDARQIHDRALHAVERARCIAKGLSPLVLMGGGFIPALEQLSADTGRVFRVPCAVECTGVFDLEDAVEANHLYRILQEGLHNAVKHSQAQSILIRLQSKGQRLIAEVVDDGIGMTTHCPPDGLERPVGAGCQDGLGMHTMAYRARVIGATLQFLKNPAGGTIVRCELPLKPNRPAGA
jgi:hypothetical protein